MDKDLLPFPVKKLKIKVYVAITYSLYDNLVYFFMKTFLTLFILLFSSLVIAENISDFYLNNAHSYKYKIEGVSLGDNLLGHYNKVEINNAYSYKYKNDKFIY